MKKTTDFFMTEQTSEDLCDSCKHSVKTVKEEPCASCVISHWEPISDDEEPGETKQC